MAYMQILLIAASVGLVWCQRPFFAGSRPIGYPEVEKPSTTADQLGNRFGEGTTQRLPLEAQGDRDLVDRLSKLPLDKQPFWLINWQALEAHRQQPQSYPIRPNPFAENPFVPNNSGNINPGSNLGNRSGDANKDTLASSSSFAPPSTEKATTFSTIVNTLKSQEIDPKLNTSNKDALEKKL
ncbi:PREDICTED: uncharacterized protein LOC106126583 [Papilio xuthus]|uniref:Uncharacterized protein LOC106126583 n=1 Tax=Papilio xuthus TaxID=66420 RepID=I4DKI1_PAPXU|nr:uncharacterized protein LOC106126583 precursor [Papilio xuthus]KPI98640.1 hypothetical protein RR46_04613 [Papilio xuthus]BAM18421.1 unknown secreted protein [Papilio xuthus]